MARLRTLKPDFFTNESLAEIDPLGRLLFAGLWTIADREGRLEDRPARIKALILPYDDCDADELLTELNTPRNGELGFIERYSVEGKRYIQVTTFTKHQTPHMREKDSTIPTPDMKDASTVLAPDKPRTGDDRDLLSWGSGEGGGARGVLEPESSLKDQGAPPKRFFQVMATALEEHGMLGRSGMTEKIRDLILATQDEIDPSPDWVDLAIRAAKRAAKKTPYYVMGIIRSFEEFGPPDIIAGRNGQSQAGGPTEDKFSEDALDESLIAFLDRHEKREKEAKGA